jgi:hypothetical protein
MTKEENNNNNRQVLTVRTPEGECVKRMEAPGGNVSGLNTSLNFSTATPSASVYRPTAFQNATQFSVNFSAYCSPVSGRIMVTLVNFSKSPETNTHRKAAITSVGLSGRPVAAAVRTERGTFCTLSIVPTHP